MRATVVAVLALAAVAAAAPLEEFADMERFITVYGAPKTLGEFYLPQEKTGLKGLFDQTMILSFKSPDKEELVSYFLTEGLRSIYKYEELAFMKNTILSGRDKAFLYLSAARVMGMPELSLPVRAAVAPAADNQNSYQKFARAVPWLLLIDQSRLQTSQNIESVIEIGQFSFRYEDAMIIRDIAQLQPVQQQYVQQVSEGEPIIVKKTEVLVQPQQQYVQQVTEGEPIVVKKTQVLVQPQQQQQYVQQVSDGQPILVQKTQQVLVQPQQQQQQQQYVQQVSEGEPIVVKKTQVLVQPQQQQQQQQYVQQVSDGQPIPVQKTQQVLVQPQQQQQQQQYVQQVSEGKPILVQKTQQVLVQPQQQQQQYVQQVSEEEPLYAMTQPGLSEPVYSLAAQTADSQPSLQDSLQLPARDSGVQFTQERPTLVQQSQEQAKQEQREMNEEYAKLLG